MMHSGKNKLLSLTLQNYFLHLTLERDEARKWARRFYREWENAQSICYSEGMQMQASIEAAKAERDEARRVARQWYREAQRLKELVSGEHEMVLFYQDEMIAAKQERDALKFQLDAANRMAASWIDSPEYKAYIERINERSND